MISRLSQNATPLVRLLLSKREGSQEEVCPSSARSLYKQSDDERTARRTISFALQDRAGKKPGQSEVSESRRVVSVTPSPEDLRVPTAHPMTLINLAGL